jgi:hypothetical protein
MSPNTEAPAKVELPLEDIEKVATGKVEERTALYQKLEEKQAILSTFKSQLLEKVDEHVSIYAKMDQTQADLAKFKEEMLRKVTEHVEELEH